MSTQTTGTHADRRTPFVNSKGAREPGIYTIQTARDGLVFEIGWRDAQGKQRWRRRVDQTGPLLKGITAARAELDKVRAAKGRGERLPANPRLRFGDAADAWWDARALRLKPATQDIYGRHLRLHLRPAFGHCRMTDIDAADVARFVATQEAAGQKGWTVKGQLVVMTAVFKYAIRHMGLRVENPIALLERGERPKADPHEPRVLDPRELERLLASVDEDFRLIFETAAETGARIAETLGIVWSEVDSSAETITFTHQLNRKGERVPLKTKRSRRCLEITPGLSAKLRAHKMASGFSGAHDFVFATSRGTGHDHRNIGGRVLGRAIKAAGLEAIERDGTVIVAAPTFHTLRHTHGSALIAAGWDIEEVSARLGHADVGTTMRVYTHAYDAARRSGERRDRLSLLYGPRAEALAEAQDGNGPDASSVPRPDASRGFGVVAPLRAKKA